MGDISQIRASIDISMAYLYPRVSDRYVTIIIAVGCTCAIMFRIFVISILLDFSIIGYTSNKRYTYTVGTSRCTVAVHTIRKVGTRHDIRDNRVFRKIIRQKIRSTVYFFHFIQAIRAGCGHRWSFVGRVKS